MEENKRKHLEFIQNVITRMNSNSFLLKGWTVTLVAAIFALAAKESNHYFAFVTYLPIPIFWVLDAYFLSQERQYRGLYNEVRIKDEKLIDFNMNASGYNKGKNTIYSSFCSLTLLCFYLGLGCVVGLIMYLLLKKP